MNFKRFSALLISTSMILSMTPAVVLADETESSGIAETTVTEKAEPEEKETAKATVSKPAEPEETSGDKEPKVQEAKEPESSIPIPNIRSISLIIIP